MPRADYLDSILVFQGQPLKLLKTETVGGVDVAHLGGYLCVFSGPADPDLTGDFFTKDTDFGVLSELGEVTLPSYYHHGLDATLGRKRIGIAKAKIDDAGVWAEHQIALRTNYEKQIATLAAKAKLGQSSGAVGHLVDTEIVEKARWLKAWPLGEASPTPTPAEPRTSAVPLKSLLIDPTGRPMKSTSLSQRMERFYRAWREGGNPGYLCDVFDADGFVIVEVRDTYYRVTFTESGEGDSVVIAFAPLAEWQKVERRTEWVAMKALFEAWEAKASREGDDRGDLDTNSDHLKMLSMALSLQNLNLQRQLTRG